MFSTRASSTGVVYVGIIGLVVLVAGATAMGVGAATGGGISDIPVVSDIIGAEGEGAEQFVVFENLDGTYRLTYIGDDPLDSTNTDVLQTTNNSGGEVLNTTDDWDNQSLTYGDVVIPNLNTEFSEGEEIDIIQHETAQIDGGDVVSQSGGELLQSVIIQPRDPEEEFEDIDPIDPGNGSNLSEGDIGVDVE
jgi:hypothetical protein